MFDEGRKNSFNPDDFEEDEEFFFSDGNDYEETGENPEFLGEEEFSSEDSKNENSDVETTLPEGGASRPLRPRGDD